MDAKNLIWEAAHEATQSLKRAEQDPRGFEIALNEMLTEGENAQEPHHVMPKKEGEETNTQKFQNRNNKHRKDDDEGIFDKKTKSMLIVVGMVLFVLLLILIIVALTRCAPRNNNHEHANANAKPVIFTYTLPPQATIR